MKVIDYLNMLGLDALKEEFGIKASVHEPTGLTVLNYDQINSPKTHPIVQECRSLVVKEYANTWAIVSRSFDRFFNYGEIEGVDHAINTYTAHEKLDGSLLNVFHYNDQWFYRTRSMIMPESLVNGFGSTWAEFIEDALDWPNVTQKMDKEYTYIFEVVGADNRVVVRYPERDAYLLAVRHNATGTYSNPSADFKRPTIYTFDTVEHCIESAKALPNLEEGYVLYKDGVPQVKVKNPAYVAAHLIKGDGLTHKRVVALVRENEQAEYLSIFPEDRECIQPYLNAKQEMMPCISSYWNRFRHIEDQKEFALAVKGLPFAAILFTMRNRGVDLNMAVEDLTMPAYTRLLENFLLKNKKLEG